MSSTEPPVGSTPHPGEPTPPTPAPSAAVPPPPPPPPPSGAGAVPPPPPPPASYGAPPVPGAGIGQPGTLLDRFLAKLIDGVILAVTYGIITAIVGGAIITGYRSGAEVYFYYLIVGILSAVVYTGYFAFLESSRGQTVGKMVVKLRVFGPDGASNPTMEQAVRRNIYFALGIVAIVPIVGWFVAWIGQVVAIILIVVGINSDPQRQHWFDKFAGGTKVTKIG